MARKFYINNNIERIFSFVLTLVIILLLNIILTNTLLDKIQSSEKAAFLRKCDDTVYNYSLAVDSKLDQLEARLDKFYAKIAYKNLPMDKIREFLQAERDQVHEPFDMVVYADKEGNSWNMEDEYFDITDRNYFHKIISGETEFYVSNLIDSKHDGVPSLMFARPVYNDQHEISGVLFATCAVSAMSKYFDEIKTSKDARFIIRDANKRIISHYNKKWVGWVYSPWKYNEKILRAGNREYYVKESVTPEGEQVYIFYKKIDITSWIIGFPVPVKEFSRIAKSQEKFHSFIVEIIVIVLSVVLMLELWIHRILEKHQILTTHIDSLTHLWARSYFEKEANKLLKRYPNSKFLLVESDIRGFKFINQNYGENQANSVLLLFSKMLYENTLKYDGILCRGYADHFFIMIKISSVHRAMHDFKAEVKKITTKAKKTDISFIPKFGLAFYLPKMKEEVQGVQILISRASFAKSTIKENALQQFAIYDDNVLQKSKNENFIESHMENALSNREFFVMYQPKIDLQTEKVVGAEALVRWQSPTLGFMPPNSFVPLFERNNFIVKLDFYVYDQVFKFIRKCMDNNEPTVPISVNVSRNHDKPEKFVHAFMALLKKYDIPPTLVEVELLERATLDKNLLRDITVMLQKEGFKVAMDDFGSGESSLNMLSTIPVNILKFDRSFLFANDSEHGKLDHTSETFIETLVGLGKNLKKETIFEGVETEEQRDFLRKIKCDQVQGYFYSKPLREDEFMKFLKSH